MTGVDTYCCDCRQQICDLCGERSPSCLFPVIDSLHVWKWSQANALEGSVEHSSGASFVLLWCSQFKQRKGVWSVPGDWGEDRRREDDRERGRKRERRDQVKTTEWKRHVWVVCVRHTNLTEEMGALRVLSTLFSVSHSWEIWSTALGGTNTQTQINCCLENKFSFPFISPRCSISPAEALAQSTV